MHDYVTNKLLIVFDEANFKLHSLYNWSHHRSFENETDMTLRSEVGKETNFLLGK